MEEAFQTWRELLGWVIRDSQKRQHLAEAIGVNPVTLTRWAVNKSNPRPDALRSLVAALPQYHEQLSRLIAEEYPYILTENLAESEGAMEVVPSSFYAQILNIHTTNPPVLRASSICLAILQQMLKQLDPQEEGIAIFIAVCVPPAQQGRKVRSLRKSWGRGNMSWHGQLEHWSQFFGAESQTGCSAVSGRPIVVMSHGEREQLFPAHLHPKLGSSVTWPILLSDSIAGCLCIISERPNCFSQSQLDVIQSYADLCALAFEPDEFYNLRQLELGIMPSYRAQQVYVASFQQHVQRRMLQAAQRGQFITRPQAELFVWQELEERLLQLSLEIGKQIPEGEIFPSNAWFGPDEKQNGAL
ncbi:GAF domain-containing protein [Ktedonosporobacter rubrisoli]|uniref:GAF domain-containing protein n=1 Tax=Ktedonosporobacter rubrisoli TaxID=2509675 RepID=A0A4P6JSU1_KTERU|nr:GAF domain-containing protein [Ktedonosporobacter rubrisoli]QBD78628.1 GAF domain-containing protein [Ktedonosporobacter rubrisoli]